MDILATFADNENLVQEVKKLLKSYFMEIDTRTDNISDEMLGQAYRARLVGLQKIEEVFVEIAKHRTRKEVPRKGVNPAR